VTVNEAKSPIVQPFDKNASTLISCGIKRFSGARRHDRFRQELAAEVNVQEEPQVLLCHKHLWVFAMPQVGLGAGFVSGLPLP
jgi:hypothetical protein